MKVPENLRYTKEHEWLKLESPQSNVALVGITQFAQKELGDIVFVDLPQAGAALKKGEAFGVVESVKTVSDLFSPVNGKVLEVNQVLRQNPEKINQDPYGEAWMVKLEITSNQDLENLLDARAYEDIIKEG